MTTDVLVIGTGISGLSYAIKLASFSSKLKIILFQCILLIDYLVKLFRLFEQYVNKK